MKLLLNGGEGGKKRECVFLGERKKGGWTEMKEVPLVRGWRRKAEDKKIGRVADVGEDMDGTGLGLPLKGREIL